MSEQALQQLTADLVAYWKAAFEPYVTARATMKPSAERPVANIIRPLMQLKSYESDEARQLVSSQVQALTGISVKKFRPRTVLIAASESGVWASELTVVATMLLAAGYKVTIATETGKPPHMLSVSCDPDFIDGPLGERVVSPEEAALAERFLDPSTVEGRLLLPQNVISLDHIVRPPLVADYLRNPEKTIRELSEGMKVVSRWTEQYNALVITGGSGAVAGFAMNGGLHHLVLAFHRLQRPIVAECNGVFALAQAIDPATGESVLRGRFATTHSKSHEYRRGGWGWAKRSDDGSEMWTLPGADGNPIIDSEPMIKNAVGPNGYFLSPPATPYAVAVDGHIITARTTPDGGPATAALLAVLDGDQPFTKRHFIQYETGFDPV